MPPDRIIESPPDGPCPACSAKRLHAKDDWRWHPYARHGFYRGQGWSHPALAAEDLAKRLPAHPDPLPTTSN